jgi:hypothetical protein
MLKKIVSLLLITAPLFSFSQAKKILPLDGQKYTVEIKEDGKKKPWEPDELVFNTGKFKCPIFGDQGWGFTKAGKYEITGIDSTTTPGVKVYSWVSDLTNDSEEQLKWSGTTKDGEVEGTIELVNKKGQTKKTFTFTGKLKGKKPGMK